MATPGEGGGGPEGVTGGQAAPRSAGKLVVTLLVVLVVTNLITAATVFYAFPQTVQIPPEELPACPDGQPRDANFNCPSPVPLKVIGPWAGAERDAFLPVLDLFSRQTGISYQFITQRQEDLQASLPLDFAAQRAPADLIFMPSSFVKTFGQQGHAENLATTINEANYAPGALDPLKVGTAIYGGAYTGKVKPGFWYRQSFFAANNLQPPTTWAEFTSLLAAIDPLVTNEAIISGDGVGWPLSDVTEHFIATYGGPNMHRQLTARTLAWTDTSVRNVFANNLVPTLQGGYWSAPRQWDTGVTEWWNGDYGLYFMGSWITGMVPDPSDLGVFSLPEAPGTTGIVFGADYFFVPKYATKLTEAKQLAQFLASATAQTMQVRQGGHLATVLNVPLTAYPAVDAEVAKLLTGKDILSDLDDTVGGAFQTTFWSQLQLLWSDPSQLDTVLANIEAA